MSGGTKNLNFNAAFVQCGSKVKINSKLMKGRTEAKSPFHVPSVAQVLHPQVVWASIQGACIKLLVPEGERGAGFKRVKVVIERSDFIYYLSVGKSMYVNKLCILIPYSDLESILLMEIHLLR